ncbi:hypothetical protein JQ628_28060 [Bradyrhizobium lablabi]|uniref:hypothetical protein n=1 Tax=Bradyrhizobium lablabi TaxID=722472 RepID=UPI001BAB86E2|nr:hypothetical protein [Bradyrhizobium lablabi]MBR1125406.1 hypothetical protein [Bradyrhizobium lablabi]
MAPRAILTPEVLAGIPALIAQGMGKAEIAERLGCKQSTLKVRCSNAGISLRERKRIGLRGGETLTLSHEALASLKVRAAAMGSSVTRLAGDLLEMIARDNLYDAVLDSAQPAAQESTRHAQTHA